MNKIYLKKSFLICVLTIFFHSPVIALSSQDFASFWQVNESLLEQNSSSDAVSRPAAERFSQVALDPFVGADESLITANIPIELIQRELRGLIVDQDSGPITALENLSFDPINRLFMLAGTVIIPADIILDMRDNLTGGHEVRSEHQFKIVVKLPSARMLSMTSFFRVEIVKLEIDGRNYAHALPVVGRFISELLAHSRFVDYILDINPEVPVDQNDPINYVRQFIERKNIRFSGQSVSFRIDVTQFHDFARFRELESLRLWQFSPVILRGTNQVVFRIEAGLGRPGSQWLSEAQARYENETRDLMTIRSEFYDQYSFNPTIKDAIDSEIDKGKEYFRLKNLNPYLKRELNEFRRHLEGRARRVLSRDNVEFLSDPERTYFEYRDQMGEEILSFLSELRRKNLIENENMSTARHSRDLPFLVQRLSQRTINQAVRFYMDMDQDGDDLFDELNVVIAPHIQGLIIRGIINLDFNEIISSSIEDRDIDLGARPIGLIEDQYGQGIPFELAMRLEMLHGGQLGLDIKSLAFLSGQERVYFNKGGRHDSFIITFVQKIVANTLAASVIDLPGEFPGRDMIIDYINRQNRSFRLVQRQQDQFDLSEYLKALTHVDISENPFVSVTRDFLAEKTQMFLENFIKYDQDKELLIFNLDPRIITDSILSVEHTVQIWSAMSIVDNELNQTYLEFGVGDGERTRRYLDSLRNRQEYQDSADFSGLRFDESFGPDFSLDLDIPSFELLLNTILTETAEQQIREVEQKLDEDKAFESYIIQNLHLSVPSDGHLYFDILLTHIEKKERSRVNPARWFGKRFVVNRKSIGLRAQVDVSLVPLNRYLGQLQTSRDETFFDDNLLRVDLQNVRVTIGGDLSIVDRVINLVGGNVDLTSGLSRRLKILVLRSLGRTLNPSGAENENVVVGDIHLNQYAKVLTHREEILIQLNPNMLNTAFEVKLHSPQNSESFAFFNRENQRIRLDFQTVGALANTDKNKLFSIMKDSNELVTPYLEEHDAERLMDKILRDQLFQKLFLSSDYTKLSLSHRLTRVLAEYEGLLSIVGPDLTVMNTIHRSLQLDLNINSSAPAEREFTSTGVELVYMATASYVLWDHTRKLLDHFEQTGLSNRIELSGLRGFSDSLLTRYVDPLMNYYDSRFKERNQRILRKGITDWNHTFYPNARYAQIVYTQLEDELRGLVE